MAFRELDPTFSGQASQAPCALQLQQSPVASHPSHHVNSRRPCRVAPLNAALRRFACHHPLPQHVMSRRTLPFSRGTVLDAKLASRTRIILPVMHTRVRGKRVRGILRHCTIHLLAHVL